MKSINIPPHISLIVGVLIIVAVRIFFNMEGTIPQAIQILGFILVIIGSAGLVGRIFRKKTKQEIT